MPLSSALWHGAATLAQPALRVMLRRRVASGKEIAARLPEREGIDATPRPPGRLLWLHAASVGESVSLLPVLPHLAGVTILLTTGTVTSAALMAERAPDVLHRFVPLDVPGWVARFLDHWRPDAAGFVESELWPNTLAACRARRIPTMLVNARMSERSARGWGRMPGLAHPMLGGFTTVWAQSTADAERLARLGARNPVTAGDLKLSAPPLPVDEAELTRLRALVAGRPVWLAASTHPGEEEIAIRVHAQLAPSHPGLLTIIAPRHPGRGPTIDPTAPHRSATADPLGGIWVADTLGELGLLYRLAPLVFVGRSLTVPGGQNPWEPARLGCALATGPHTANFAPAIQVLREAGALTEVADGAALAAWVDAMLRDPLRRQAAGEAARAAASATSDLPERTAQALLALIP